MIASMRPILFTIGSTDVPSHGFFVFVGVLAAGAVFFFEAERREMLTAQLLLVLAITLVGGAIGARLAIVAREWLIDPSAGDLLTTLKRGGRSILGGLAGAYVGALAGKRIVGYRAKTGDVFAPAVALGMAIGRWGCFLAETPGTPTALPWGVRLSADQVRALPSCAWCAPGVPLHPSFAYEIVFQAVAFAVLWRLRRVERMRGHLFEAYLLGYAIFRFAVEFVRGNAVVLAGLSGSQLFLVPSTALLVWYFARQASTHTAVPGAGATA